MLLKIDLFVIGLGHIEMFWNVLIIFWFLKKSFLMSYSCSEHTKVFYANYFCQMEDINLMESLKIISKNRLLWNQRLFLSVTTQEHVQQRPSGIQNVSEKWWKILFSLCHDVLINKAACRCCPVKYLLIMHLT